MISSEIGQSECDDILSTHPKSFTGMVSVSIKYVAAFSSNRELETQPLAFATTSLFWDLATINQDKLSKNI